MAATANAGGCCFFGRCPHVRCRSPFQFIGPTGKDTGPQHYEAGLTGRYSLNQILNIPQRYGQWSINGYIFYSDGLSNKLRADTQLWGGAGIQFSY